MLPTLEEFKKLIAFRFNIPEAYKGIENSIRKQIADYRENLLQLPLKDERRVDARKQLYSSFNYLFDNTDKYDCPFCNGSVVSGATVNKKHSFITPDDPEVYYMFCAHCYASFPLTGTENLSEDPIMPYIKWFELCNEPDLLWAWMVDWETGEEEG